MTSLSAFITGSNGFVGSHLAEYLLSQGMQVFCLVRKTGNLKNLEALNVHLLYADLQDADCLEAIMPDVDYVFHCGGKTKAGSRNAFFDANAHGTRYLLDAVLKKCTHLKRFVYVSSQAAAGPCETPEPIDETALPHPVTWYGESKLAGEEIVQAYALKLHVTIIRPPTVYGPRDTDVYEAFRSVKFHVKATVGFAKRFLSIIYVKDLVCGLYLAAINPESAGRTYFLTSDARVNWMHLNQEIAEAMDTFTVPVYIPLFMFACIAWGRDAVSRITGRPHIISRQKFNEFKAPYWLCDRTAAERDFGYVPEYCLTRGIRLTLEWYHSNGWL